MKQEGKDNPIQVETEWPPAITTSKPPEFSHLLTKSLWLDAILGTIAGGTFFWIVLLLGEIIGSISTPLQKFPIWDTDLPSMMWFVVTAVISIVLSLHLKKKLVMFSYAFAVGSAFIAFIFALFILGKPLDVLPLN